MQWQPTPVLLPGKSHGRRGLIGYSPWDCEESDTTEQLHFHFSLSCIGEVNGNPLQWALAWRIPGTAEPGGLLSMESHRVRHNWRNLAAAAIFHKTLAQQLSSWSIHSSAHLDNYFMSSLFSNLQDHFSLADGLVSYFSERTDDIIREIFQAFTTLSAFTSFFLFWC